MEGLTREVKELILGEGADLVGIADLKLLEGIHTHPPDLLDLYPYGISIAIDLDRFEDYDSETEDRSYEMLERIARHAERFIKAKGYQAKVVTASEVVEGTGRYGVGEISHKAIAKAAGLGWIGKSNLLVTPQYGPRISLISILTDAPLIPDEPFVGNRCGECKDCINACPANALRETKFEDHPRSRKDVLDVERCGRYTETYEKGVLCWECRLGLSLWEEIAFGLQIPSCEG